MNAIEFENVSKAYAVYASPRDRVRELLMPNRPGSRSQVHALRDVTFSVRRGESFGVIGENGSGKSTLLQLVAGILRPTAGAVRVRGTVAALLELGSGFNPEYTGRENVYLNAAVLGFTNNQIEHRFDAIQRFADLGDFIDRPVKTYSSGMTVRLAFAVAVHVNPEILLVDEALSVGDAGFRQRCMRMIHALRSQGVTIIVVTHSMAEAKAIGERALWLHHGAIKEIGEAATVVDHYAEAVAHQQNRHNRCEAAGTAPEAANCIPNIDRRLGTGRARVTGTAVLGALGTPTGLLDAGAGATVRISARAGAAISKPVIGFALRNHLGIEFSGTDTERERIILPPLAPGGVCTVDFQLQLPDLYPGSFSVSPFVSDPSGICDWIDNAVTVQVTGGSGPVYGYIHLPCRIQFNSSSQLEASRG